MVLPAVLLDTFLSSKITPSKTALYGEDIQHVNPDPEFQVTAFFMKKEDKTLGPGLYSFEIRSEFKFCRAGLYLETPTRDQVSAAYQTSQSAELRQV